MPVENVPSADERLDEILALLPESVRYNAEEELRSWLEPVAKVDTYLAIRREKLAHLVDVDELPDSLVALLAQEVGLGPDLAAVAALDTATLRKLIPSMVGIWKTKGTTPSLRTVVAAIGGSRALILDWFQLRWVTGTPRAITLIPSGGGIGFPYTYPEHVADVWYMDPTGSEVDADQLSRVLDVVRSSGERLNLRPALFLDDLLQGDAFWTRFGSGGSHTYQEVDAGGWEHSVQGTDGYFADLDGASESWTSYRWNTRLQLDGSNHAASLWVLMETEGDGNESYRVDIDGPAGEVRIYRVDAGVATLLASTSGHTIAAGYPYDWSIEADAAGSSTAVHVYQEGVLRTSYLDTHANRKTGGGVAFAGENANAQVGHRHSLGFASNTLVRVGPNP